MEMPTHIIAVGGMVDDKGEILLVKNIHGGWVFPGDSSRLQKKQQIVNFQK